MTTPSADHILATQQHRSRLKETDPTYLRLRDATARRLSLSLQRLVRELRGAHQTEQHTALSEFITRQTAILQDAYIASYQAGASDYFGEVSNAPSVWAKKTPVDPERMRKALAFYAPSIAKMAHQALAAVSAAPGVKLEELIAEADNTIKLFGFFGGFSRVTSGMRGALGGVGEDANHTLYSAHGHHFAGRAKGEHNEANIHEHLAAQHHGEGEGGGGGGRRLSRPAEHSPNEGAHSTESIRRMRSENAGRSGETRFGQRPESRIDETGQAMPFNHGEFRFALTRMRPLSEDRSGVNLSGFIKIEGKDYFAKAVVDSYYHPQEEAIHEVVANNIAKMMGIGSHVPAESYYLHFNDYHWNVMTLERGVKTFEEMENGDGRFHTKLERALRHPDAIKEMLFEYIVANSHGDRHEGNVMFQPTNERIIHIDFGRAFPETSHDRANGVVFRPYSSGFISRLWSTQFAIHHAEIGHPSDRGIAEHVKIPHEDLAGIRKISQRILDMAERSGLGLDGKDHLDALRTRLNVLEELSLGGDKTAADLIDTAESYV